jgi:hypothetical protein
MTNRYNLHPELSGLHGTEYMRAYRQLPHIKKAREKIKADYAKKRAKLRREKLCAPILKCSKCRKMKPRDEFYVNHQTNLPYRSCCECHKKRVRKTTLKNMPRHREAVRRYAKRRLAQMTPEELAHHKKAVTKKSKNYYRKLKADPKRYKRWLNKQKKWRQLHRKKQA